MSADENLKKLGLTLPSIPTPVGTYVPLTQDPVGWAWHLVLPWCVLAILSAAVYTRITRSQMLEVLDESYVPPAPRASPSAGSWCGTRCATRCCRW